MPRTFYRIVKSSPPTDDDFVPKVVVAQAVLAKRPDLARLMTGISVFDDVELARKKAVQFPVLGDLLAEVTIPDDSPIRFERTTSSRGHYTMWGDQTQLRQLVTRIEPVGPR